jgi:hypothetical protein
MQLGLSVIFCDTFDAPACLETTGRYSLGSAGALNEAGHVVSIVNPAQIRDFARTKLGRNKTDGVDASHLRTAPLQLKIVRVDADRFGHAGADSGQKKQKDPVAPAAGCRLIGGRDNGEPGHREPVLEIVRSQGLALVKARDLASLGEVGLQSARRQTATPGAEKEGLALGRGEHVVTLKGVPTKGCPCRRVNRKQAVFTKLGLANEDDATCQIDIAAVEPDCFADRRPVLANNPTSVASVLPLKGILGEMRLHASMSDVSSTSLRMRGGGIARDLAKARRSRISVRRS